MSSWTRVGLLGEGSYGIVSLAKSSSSSPSDSLQPDDVNSDPKLPPLFAVKSSEFSLSQPLQEERILLSELQDCPNIIQCYGSEVTQEDGVIFYNVMLEYAAGGSLLDRIYYSPTPLLEDEVKRLTRSILKGLSYIHEKGCAHCDIKPSNILLVDAGAGSNVAKIADFGLSKRVQKSSTKQRRNKSKIDWKAWRGTAVYMAPESILCDEYDFGVDIWGLGCSVFEMLTKRVLRNISNSKVKDKAGLLVKMANQRVEIPEGFSKEAKDFLEKCLVNDPVQRWTANMLLRHPFVSGLEAEEEEIGLISTSEVELPEEDEDLEWLMKPMLLINPSAALQRRKRFLSDDSVSEISSKRPKRLDLDRDIKPLGRGVLQPCC
ncbi:OLC1v1023875C1 [Oldenlandia corymbosa var. corymbosa]|uniref:OLC1v1023875C1 n=1 Tax=Oldenlandia corymbosa var. corymbosa TaxID=529605 RepID=A0AAV1C1Q6_OLDCO|nr:OLC1v1023875C1 [Oldenlandia corymbosa var. corymbosa]